MFSTQLNRIFALVRLRRRIHDVCLVGCVGDINAGKTTMVRKLRGLEPLAEGQCATMATRFVSVFPLPMHTPEGLQEVSRAPLLVDTPGMFDQNEKLADCALKFLGECSVMNGQQPC